MDATKMMEQEACLKSLSSVFLSYFLVFVFIGWDEAVLLFAVLYLKGRKLLTFLGVYILNAIKITFELLTPSTILTSITSGLLKSLKLQCQFGVFGFGLCVQFLLELAILLTLRKIAIRLRLKDRIGF